MNIKIVFALISLFLFSSGELFGQLTLTKEQASILAEFPLKCMEQEYPNKLNQVISGEEDLRTPKDLHPVFYGCFDWHSALHGHWMLVRLLKAHPELEERDLILETFDERFTPENFKEELGYFLKKENKSFERTYGWAWLLKFAAELRSWDAEEAANYTIAMQPLEDLIVKRYLEFLPKLTYPIRSGEHPNTAFGLSLAWDYAEQVGNIELMDMIAKRSRDFYLDDKGCPLTWEPSGFDFLSPCLQEAALMKRVLPQEEFEIWFESFLPLIIKNGTEILEPATVSDRSDGKLVHLDGLNFCRAWCLYEIAENAGSNAAQLKEIARIHFNFSFDQIRTGEYSGEHWLASFAVYALDAGGALKD